jgi:hypothetical protein
MARACEGPARKAVKLSSYKMAKRVAGERIRGQKGYVEKQNQGSDAYSDSSVKEQSAERVAPKKDEENEPHVQKISMEVLQNKGKRILASIVGFTALADCASGRVKKKSAVVSLSVVVTGDPESQRPNQNQ